MTKRLAGADWHESPNVGGVFAPRLIMIHYTAGRGFEQSIRWLCNPKARSSAHFVVGRGAELAQLAELDARAWHAGRSRLELELPERTEVLEHLNGFAFGIELDNPGKLVEHVDGWRTWYGEPWPDSEVVLAEHKHGGGVQGWASYPVEQIEKAYELAEELVDLFPDLVDVVGHDDAARGRKLDPGPAFPLDSFRSWVFGREDAEAPDFR